MSAEKQFLNYAGLSTLLNKLKEKLATKAAVQAVKNDTDMYVTDVDYSQIQFDTSESYETILEKERN
jgi:flavoprotein